jgi:hypothetical protein
MRYRKWILASLFAAGTAVSSAPSLARTYVDVEIAPPPALVEVVPAPRPGWVWAPGYYSWNGHKHVWYKGHYIRERHGYHWVPDSWEDRHGHYHYNRGHWEHG